jgi:hypothetical protein
MEEHRLRVFENRVLTRIFVLFANHNKNDQVKEDEMGRAYSTNGAKRNAYKILVGNRRKETTGKAKT